MIPSNTFQISPLRYRGLSLRQLKLNFCKGLKYSVTSSVRVKLSYMIKERTLRKIYHGLTHFILETPKGVLAKSADPDQMPHNVASDLGLHYFASCSTIFQQKYLN